MLRPIPSNLLKETAVLSVCTGIDEWQAAEFDSYTISRVHLQATNEIRRSTDRADVVLAAILFVDSRLSSPVVDWYTLQRESEAAGRTMRVEVYDASGASRGVFEVKTVDAVPDYPSGRIHHWEIGLV